MPPLGNNQTPAAYGPGVAGRPKVNVGNLVLRPISGKAGFTFDNAEPAVIQKATADIKKHEMPPNMKPTRSRAKQNVTNKRISKGWAKPKDGR